MSFFAAHTLRDLPSSKCISLSTLISGENPLLYVPVFAPAECPEPNSVRVGAYVSGPLSGYVIPIYGSESLVPAPTCRAVSAITATP